MGIYYKGSAITPCYNSLVKFRQLVDRSITTVTAEDLVGVTSIGSSAFYGCSSLTSVTIGDGVTSIEYAAFSSCGSLTSVTIGDGVKRIGIYVLNNCSRLTSVTIKATIPPTLSNVNAFNNTNNCPIYVPYASITAYSTASNWASIASRLFPLVNTIADLQTIDTTIYTKACVIGTDNSYKEYTYDGSQWNEVI